MPEVRSARGPSCGLCGTRVGRNVRIQSYDLRLGTIRSDIYHEALDAAKCVLQLFHQRLYHRILR